MTFDGAPSELAFAALSMLTSPAAAADLEQRFRERGATLEPGVAAALFDELRVLGLVRATGGRGAARRYVTTSLGQRFLDAHPLAGDVDALADLERLRSDLLATIAHEFRTPLTALRTGVGLLLDDTLAPTVEQRRSLLETIARNTERMQRLVGDILDLARFRAGEIALQLRRFDAMEIVVATVTAIEPLARRHQQEIVVHRTSAHVAVFGDRRRLEQALLNLVSNAQKFSADGGRIDIRLEPRGEAVAWTVVDHGPGIPDEDQARLFERFFVGRNDVSGAREGAGLGLPTALAIAQAHGGTIEVRSAVGAGSTFALVVPVDGPPEAE